MYYLNDQHPEYEYAIYCRINNACPYIANVYGDKKTLEIALDSIKRYNGGYHYSYYVDYPGFKNEYPKELANKYYKVLKRPVADWEEIA